MTFNLYWFKLEIIKFDVKPPKFFKMAVKAEKNILAHESQ